MNTKHIVMLLLLPGSSALTQSVDTLVQEALKNNPQVSSFDHRIQATDSRSRSAGAWPAPTIGVEFSQVPTTSGNLLSDAIANNYSISQMFMLGGKLSAMSEVERTRGSILEESRSAFLVDLRGRVKMNYYRLWLLDRQIEVGEQTLNTLNRLVEAMRMLVMTNRVAQADLLSLQAEAASVGARLIDRRAQRIGLLNVLNGLLGRDNVNQGVKTDSLPASVAVQGRERDLSERLASTNPSLLAMDRMTEMNEAMIVSARKDLIPDLMVQAMIMRMPNGMLLTSGSRSVDAIQQSAMGMPMQKTGWMYSIMASITLPFAPWASERSTAKSDEMREANLGIAAERDAMRREMIAALHSALTEYVSKDSLAREYKSTILPLVLQSAEAQTTAYQNGKVPVTAVLDARRMELMRQEEYFMVIMDREMALIQVEMMVGGSL
jgi:cobalt-zinc-cadmium efflux system outer membrane protein